MSQAPVAVEDATRSYELDGITVPALRGVSLTVEHGDYLAIVGPSGSGKSTLMHLLGGLDRPTSGRLLLGGRDVSTLSAAELARLRNEVIGFVFQSFHLLSRTSARDNVALPLIYRGLRRSERRRRAEEMLARVGLAHRMDHRPNQLSGGEQQRVAIARALVTAPSVLLADEPTGNLDSRSGEAVLKLLEELNSHSGVAVAVVTHDAAIASRARRQITMRDGVIVEPRAVSVMEAWRVAIDSLRASRLRSGLTMLGVVIGVAAVVILVAIGTGTKIKIENEVEGLGSNLLLIVPGQVDFNSAPTVSRLRLEDVDVVTRLVGDRNRVAAATASGETVRAGTRSRFTSVTGVLETTPKVFVRDLARGAYLSRSDVETGRRVAVLGSAVADSLFGERDPVGAQIAIASVRFRVVGVFEPLGQSLGVDRDNEVHIPITTAQRLFDTSRVDAMAVKAPDRASLDALGRTIVAELNERHPDGEFSVVTQEQILGVLGDILGILTAVLAAIAGISLLVGGVGVSNIMLVSVRERTKEIGLRKAVGARPRDIAVQFLLEAVLLTTIGGTIGIALGIGTSLIVGALTPVPAAVTWWSVALAFGVSAVVGIVFGVVPAQRAGRLDPVVALRTE